MLASVRFRLPYFCIEYPKDTIRVYSVTESSATHHCSQGTSSSPIENQDFFCRRSENMTVNLGTVFNVNPQKSILEGANLTPFTRSALNALPESVHFIVYQLLHFGIVHPRLRYNRSDTDMRSKIEKDINHCDIEDFERAGFDCSKKAVKQN